MQHSKYPVVLAGDFNATPWSIVFQNFLDETGLHNAAYARGGGTTWPTFLPLMFRIPIDHILLSKQLVSTSFLVGPEMGSDHLPFFGRFVLLQSTAAK
ncbi:MAG: hypothetical protein GY822_15915 [Deltaproteobacteria bacterium]|nr:hypothetical protein [Deltaproteobacteria bacterium]